MIPIMIPMDNGQNTIDPKTKRPYIPSDELLGMFATPGQPAPTDVDVERLLVDRYDPLPETPTNPTKPGVAPYHS